MKCCVCTTEIPEGVMECPCCGFVDERRMRILGDAQKIAEQVEANAAAHRKRFLHEIDIGLLTYTWKDSDGTLTLDSEHRASFGKCDAILAQPQWLEQRFARVPGVSKVEAILSVQRAGQPEKRLHVEVDALPQAQLQSVGVSMLPDMTVRLLVKNSTASVQSEPISII